VTEWGVHRRAFHKAKAEAWWLEATDQAAVRAAEDLADRLDSLRKPTIKGLIGDIEPDSLDHWRASAVHSRFLQALEALQMTPGTWPASPTVADNDLIAALAATMTGE
jgi:hypothetical protein